MKEVGENLFETDVLVVGGGAAGCWAAIKAREATPRVILADKGVVARSGTAIFCHDVLAPTPEGEQQAWLTEVVEHAEQMSDRQFVQILLSEEGARINELISWGVPFERDERGELFLSLGRGHKVSKVLLGDFRKLMEALRRQVKARGITLLERAMITDLLTSDGQHTTAGRVVGAVGLHTRGGEFLVIKAKAVVVATGVISAKLKGQFADNITGDGQAMAFRAGAEMAGLEFNFGPAFVSPRKDRMVLLAGLWPFQTQGARLVNASGERFMERYRAEQMERRSTQGILGRAVLKEILEGRGPVYFDMRHFSPEKIEQVRRILPSRMASLQDAGIDISKDLIEVRPILTYIGAGGCGGIRIDTQGETTIPGLLAAGVTAQFPGCAESLSGLKIAVCNVFGARAGSQAGELARETDKLEINQDQVARFKEKLYAPLNIKAGLRPREIYQRMNLKLVKPEYGLVKTERRIKEIIALARRLKEEDLPQVAAQDVHQLIHAREVENFLELIPPAFACALERKESRLAHYRADYPFRDDIDWLTWVIVKKDGDGLATRLEPLPKKLKEAKRIPAPIVISLPG